MSSLILFNNFENAISKIDGKLFNLLHLTILVDLYLLSY